MTPPSGTETLPALTTFGPYLAILVGAALPTQIWRWLGVMLAGRVGDASEVFIWVKAVATALVASVVAKLILSPGADLATTPLALRVGAVAAGFALYLATGRRLWLGIVVTEAVLLTGWLLLR
ncbi:branched-chain amino acid transport [Acuticoccus sediminis]|uniref:Branched-chain amino acid transport n=1 Tax=Acuticoccus sediminis TaxID=2184697 RepID=A0A8B2NN41_9HYPH|nr:AzlD domain-containing protein [Acuticoccus sediminis]RAH98147.1 branched-chain amino acid transport [Acuticoccus sediminis]